MTLKQSNEWNLINIFSYAIQRSCEVNIAIFFQSQYFANPMIFFNETSYGHRNYHTKYGKCIIKDYKAAYDAYSGNPPPWYVSSRKLVRTVLVRIGNGTQRLYTF